MIRSHRPLVLVVVFLVVVLPAGALDTAGPSEPTDPSLTVTVTGVVNGDTVDVQYTNGTTDRVRLLGVDTPKVSARNDPTEFEGVPNTTAGKQCLDDAGANASAYTKDTLDPGERIDLVLDEEADTRGYYGRLLAYVYDGGRNLNYELIERGYARVYDGPFGQNESFYTAESASQTFDRGLWHCRNPRRALPVDYGAPVG